MVSIPPVPPDRPDHDDPTGIRALLSGLPDPGPMPASLVDRINASIAAEQSSRADESTGATVVPLHRRRPTWQRVGLAAAAAAVVAVGVPALLNTMVPGGVVTSLSSGSADSAEDSGGSGYERGGGAATAAPPSSPGVVAPRTQTPSPDQRAAGPLGNVALMATGTAYTSSGLATQARAAMSNLTSDKSSAPREGGVADTQKGLRACLTAVGVEAWMPVTGDLATFEGRPAVIAVVSSDTGQTVYAVAPDCDATHPTVLSGPVPLP